jgi:hypothetical protein
VDPGVPVVLVVPVVPVPVVVSVVPVVVPAWPAVPVAPVSAFVPAELAPIPFVPWSVEHPAMPSAATKKTVVFMIDIAFLLLGLGLTCRNTTKSQFLM